ncbi:MAG: hypothetical protein GYB65_16650 [Chloroflexi bacterium]|nr:hypothetical protein [Chloroflexota bacterium]
MSRKLVLGVLILVLAAALVLPAAAQDDGAERFLLPRNDLFARFEMSGDGVNQGDVVGDITLELQGNQGLGFRVQINADLQGGGGVYNDLVVILMPAIADGAVRWQVVSWDVTDASGAIVDDPPAIIAVLIGLLRDAWRDAFMGSLRSAIQQQYPNGMPGRPQFTTVYVDHNHTNVIVDLVWNTTRSSDAPANDPLAAVVLTGPPTIPQQGAGTVTHIITQDMANAALDVIADHSETLQFFTIEFGEGRITSLVSVSPPNGGGILNLQLDYVPNLNFNGTDTFTYRFFGSDGSLGEAEYMLASVTNVDTGAAITDGTSNTIALMVSRTMNRYLTAQIGLGQVTDVTVRSGALEITVAPR